MQTQGSEIQDSEIVDGGIVDGEVVDGESSGQDLSTPEIGGTGAFGAPADAASAPGPGAAGAATAATAPAAGADDPATRAAALERELAAARDQALRARAELDNVQKRMRRELDEQRSYANAEALRDVLPVLDNLDMTLLAARQAPGDTEALLRGVDMIRQQLDDLLRQRGAVRIETTGQSFDPAVHEAISVVPGGPEAKANTVVQEVRRGYRVKDRVLRAAQVIVSK